MDAAPANISLPQLRQDLELIDAGLSADENSRWSLYDPARNSFFRISRQSFLLLSLWHLASSNELKSQAQLTFDIEVCDEQLEVLIHFLESSQLLVTDNDNQLDSLIRQRKSSKRSWHHRLVHGYLFFRIPLVKPDRFLSWLTSLTQPFLNAGTLLFFLLSGGLGLILSLRQWDSFLHTATGLLTFESLVWFFSGLVLTKICHELGHGVAAKYYGCRVPTMGVAFLVMFPVLYTDTTDAWRLGARKSKLIIGSAGVLVELMMACLATLLWSFMPEGPVRSALFMLAAVTWVTSLLVNANPLMRFDGYYLLSDYWQIENLQSRAFRLARWQLRQWLFCFDEAAPESFSRRDHRKLLIYAYATWIYRFFLFLGIALLVYHLFFKVLGIVLFLVEIVWFILLPVTREMSYWWQHRDKIQLRVAALRTGLLLSSALAFLLFPFDSRLELPAVVTAEKNTEIYSPDQGSQITQILVKERQQVSKGQPLLVLDNPDLQQEAVKIRLQISLVRKLLSRAASSDDYNQLGQVFRSQLITLREKLAGIEARLKLLVITAPFDGRITFLSSWLREGIWVNNRMSLLRLNHGRTLKINAYVESVNLSRVSSGQEGVFYPDDITRQKLKARLVQIHPTTNNQLERPYLSSEYGGPLPVSTNDRGEAVLQQNYYKVELDAEQNLSDERVLTGSLHLNVKGESIAYSVWERIWSVLIREMGV